MVVSAISAVAMAAIPVLSAVGAMERPQKASLIALAD